MPPCTYSLYKGKDFQLSSFCTVKTSGQYLFLFVLQDHNQAANHLAKRVMQESGLQ